MPIGFGREPTVIDMDFDRAFDECPCECHTPRKNVIVTHFEGPCCTQCPVCRRDIIQSLYDRHVRRCKNDSRKTLPEIDGTQSEVDADDDVETLPPPPPDPTPDTST